MISSTNPKKEVRFSRLDRQYAKEVSKLLDQLSDTVYSWKISDPKFPAVVTSLHERVFQESRNFDAFVKAATQNPPDTSGRPPDHPRGGGISLAFTGF